MEDSSNTHDRNPNRSGGTPRKNFNTLFVTVAADTVALNIDYDEKATSYRKT